MASGRTTALKTLFSSLAPGKQVDIKTVPRADSLQTFQSDPAAMCTDIVMEGNTTCRVHYSVQVQISGLTAAHSAALWHLLAAVSYPLVAKSHASRHQQSSIWHARLT